MSVGGDIVIVGAGIVGAACASECVRAGLRTAVVEASVIGGGATAAGMGHLVVMDDSEAQFALTHYSRTLWDELAPGLPADVQFQRCGTVWAAADEDEMREVRRKRDFYERRGVAAELLDARRLAEAEPNLRGGLAGGLRVPGDSVIYPPCAARWLLEQAVSRGARVRERTRVLSLRGGEVRLSDDTRLSAGAVVIATGGWAPELLPDMPVRKRKGHLVITDRYPGFVRHQVVELGYLKSAHGVAADSVAFNVQPRSNGQILIGSSRQYGSDGAAVEPGILGRMLARALEYMPRLRGLSALRAWTGFRAATPDKLPLIGPSPGDRGLYLAAGHEGLGITTSLGTAKLLVDHVLGRTPAIPPEPYLPSRPIPQVQHG
jgi:glycine/D-amino acid oxidase-like deaminating enzyme